MTTGKKICLIGVATKIYMIIVKNLSWWKSPNKITKFKIIKKNQENRDRF